MPLYNRKYSLTGALSIILLFMIACSDGHMVDRKLEDALALAGSNRPQLEATLDYFAEDSLGLEAAKFLIRNMPGHYSYKDTIAVGLFYDRLDTLVASLKGCDSKIIQDSVKSFCERERLRYFPVIQDVRIIRADFLIDNIVKALKQWREKPWCDRLDFEQFCEYLLPYKTAELQELKPWRDRYGNFYDDALERMKSCSLFRISAFQVAEFVNERLSREFPYDPETYEIPPLYYRSLSRLAIPFGTCEELCNSGLNIFRAAGVPCTIDYVPLWGYGNRGHTWGVLLAPNGKNMPFVPVHMSPYVVHKVNETVSKAYRHTYAQNQELIELNSKSVFVPEFFRNIFQKDVTNQYADTRDLSVEVRNCTQPFAYLCTTSGNEWKPVAYTKAHTTQLDFKDVGKGCIYSICEYLPDGELRMLTEPFKIERNGEYVPINPDLNNKKNIRLYRKGPLLEYAWKMAIFMENGVFEASDSPDFSRKITVGAVNTSAEKSGEISVPEEVKGHRYWRYAVDADTAVCSVGEIRFISDGEDVTAKGRAIGNSDVNSESVFHDMRRAFDGNVLTPITFSHCGEAWVGLDFGEKVRIDKIRYTPRSDGDMIEPGDVYELLYWNNSRWQSLGQKTATEVYIDYENVPSDAIYILRDRTKGSSERIFLIDNDGKQEWW